ncbi:hypothetical protein HPB50_003310 [Hyalomma asiaticum]|uniref:Uncharacterized protein n=1 Tax=Hyalomma asiaticum TaxID=266040 RepID=A0ACB7SDN6_HYAAI|nr:hypothetical protein HPB50_003310 [Hyalomma asiaticum]
MIRLERPAIRALLLGFLVASLYCIHKGLVIDVTYSAHVTAPPQPTDESKRERYVVDTAGCKIPNFDPFDESVRKYYKKVGRYSCKGKASFIRLVNGSTPVLDAASLVTTFRLKPKDVRCTYAEIYRNESVRVPDDAFFLRAPVALTFGEPLGVEYAHVQCYRDADTLFHQEYLLVPLLKDDVEQRCDRKAKGSGLNVLVLGLDSVSRLNFRRHLSETGRYVRHVLKGYELMGYHKVGLNSYPNQTPLLTGLSGEEAKNATGGKFFDALDFLWKRYAEKGYRTVFHEEQPKYGLYSYVGDGLRHAPTDYYTRHAVMAIDKSKLKKNSYCLGPRPPLDLYLDYMVGLFKVLDKRPFFAYFWMSELAHDHLNMAGHCDAPLREALGRLHESGILNNTVLVFMSDHGLRFGPLRQTYIGRFEDSLPYAFLVFPPWFLQRHPAFAAALDLNQRRLTTHFDMHATLLQLLHPGLPRTAHGQSLLHELPATRTCADASVPAQFCACVETEAFPLNHPVSLKVARFVVASVNTLAGSECAKWELKSVLAIRFYPRHTGSGNTTDSDYWVKLSAAPGDAVFEATVRHSVDWRASRFSLLQQADRLDWYSSRSQCARGSRWEKYCHCIRPPRSSKMAVTSVRENSTNL